MVGEPPFRIKVLVEENFVLNVENENGVHGHGVCACVLWLGGRGGRWEGGEFRRRAKREKEICVMSATDGQWVDVFAAEMLRRLLLFLSFHVFSSSLHFCCFFFFFFCFLKILFCCFACTRLSDCCRLTVNKGSLTTTTTTTQNYYYYYSKLSLSLFDTCRWKRTGLSFHPLFFMYLFFLSTHKIGGEKGGEREYIQKDGLPTPNRAELQIGHKRKKWPGVSQASLQSQIGVTKRAESRKPNAAVCRCCCCHCYCVHAANSLARTSLYSNSGYEGHKSPVQ